MKSTYNSELEKLHKRRPEIIDQIKSINNICGEIKGDESLQPLIHKLSDHILGRARKIESICKNNKYDFYFIGDVGIGKSTAICTLFGLMDLSKFTPDKNPEKETVLSDLCLLKTGAGRTTICETVIKPNQITTEITIDPVEPEEFEKRVRLYVESLLDHSEQCGKKHKWTDSLSKEERKIIVRMASLDKDFENKIKEQYKESGGDSLVDAVIEDILEKTRYNERTKTKFLNDSNLPFGSWLKKMISDINDGKLSDVPMPEKIEVHFSEEDTPKSMPSFVNSITDTRGINKGERPDLQEYVKLPNSVSVFCDKIEKIGANSGINSILRQTLIKEERDNQLRVLLLGIDQGSSLYTAGEGDIEKGIQNKKDEAKDEIPKDINFNASNIYLTNTATGIEIGNAVPKVKEINEKDLESGRYKFYSKIIEIMSKMYGVYSEELHKGIGFLRKLREGKVGEELGKKIKYLESIVDEKKENQKDKLKKSDIQGGFEDKITNVNASALRGAVNGWGVGLSENVYGIFQLVGHEIFIKECDGCKEGLTDVTKTIFDSDEDIIKKCGEYIIEQIDDDYKKNLEAYKETIGRDTIEKLYNEASWSEAKKFWGQGFRYRDRVWDEMNGKLGGSGIYEELNDPDLKIEFLEKISDFRDMKK